MEKKRIVVALGGNALGKTPKEQLELVKNTAKPIGAFYSEEEAKFLIEEKGFDIEERHFAPGSMLPKVQAAMAFAGSKPGRRALITSLEKAVEGIQGKTGTLIKM